ncbi:hypothetical protein B7463_g8346, partial [Scytalidium lignicola]
MLRIIIEDCYLEYQRKQDDDIQKEFRRQITLIKFWQRSEQSDIWSPAGEGQGRLGEAAGEGRGQPGEVAGEGQGRPGKAAGEG